MPAVTLSELLGKHNFQTINLIADIEGAEVTLVKNESDVLRKHVMNLIMETHPEFQGPKNVAEMLTTLEDLGFELCERWHDDTKVVAFRNRHLT